MVLNEVFSTYDAVCRGEELKKPEPRPFREYINWLQQQNWSTAEYFWRQRLKGFTVPTALRTIRPRRNHDDAASGRGEQQVKLTQPLTSRLKVLASENRVTLSTVMQGAWAILLSRYSGEEDVVSGPFGLAATQRSLTLILS